MRKRGFTLIELLVVIAIIGILSSIILASLSGARSKGRDTKRIADIKELQLAIQLFYDANGRYPSSSGDVGVAGVLSALTTANYISVLPSDPSAGDHYAYLALPASCSGSACADYVLGAQLENSNAGLDSYKTSQAITINGGDTNCNATNVLCEKP